MKRASISLITDLWMPFLLGMEAIPIGQLQQNQIF